MYSGIDVRSLSVSRHWAQRLGWVKTWWCSWWSGEDGQVRTSWSGMTIQACISQTKNTESL
jgi:hypothetical protein